MQAANPLHPPLPAQVPLHAIKALHQEDRKSPFGHTPWRSGALHLRFLPVRGGGC